MGREALAKKKFLSAGEHLQRAGVYYHFGKFLFVQDLAQMKAAHMKAVECRKLALPHLRPPGERVEMPYEGKWLAGILRKPVGVERPPVVAFACGLDSCKEETDAYEQPFLARGMATLAFDGPGQGEGEYDFAIRGDYEVAVKAVIDFIETRRDLDATRVGIAGISLGGYYAPRAAAFDKRIKACLALGGPYRLGRMLRERARSDARGVPRAQQERHARGGAPQGRDALAQGRRAEHHLPDLHHERQARPHRAGEANPSGWRAR